MVIFLAARPVRLCRWCHWLRCGGCAFGWGAVLRRGLTGGICDSFSLAIAPLQQDGNFPDVGLEAIVIAGEVHGAARVSWWFPRAGTSAEACRRGPEGCCRGEHLGDPTDTNDPPGISWAVLVYPWDSASTVSGCRWAGKAAGVVEPWPWLPVVGQVQVATASTQAGVCTARYWCRTGGLRSTVCQG